MDGRITGSQVKRPSLFILYRRGFVSTSRLKTTDFEEVQPEKWHFPSQAPFFTKYILSQAPAIVNRNFPFFGKLIPVDPARIR